MIVLVQIILIIVGIFTTTAGIFGWDWVMSHWRSRLFVRMFGRNGARAFYVILGLVVVGLGALLPIMLHGN